MKSAIESLPCNQHPWHPSQASATIQKILSGIYGIVSGQGISTGISCPRAGKVYKTDLEMSMEAYTQVRFGKEELA